MKKICLKFFTIFLIILFFCSCTNKQSKLIVGVSICNTDNWREQMQKEMLQEIPFYRDISLEFKIADGNDLLQSKQIDKFVEDKIDLLIVIPNKSEIIVDAVNKAYDSGIKVIVIDNNKLLKNYTAFLGVNNLEIGRRAGEYANSLIKDKGGVLELMGRCYSVVAQERHIGFESAILKDNKLVINSSIDAFWQEQPAQRITDSLLRVYPNTKLIFAHNDVMAYGAYKAVKDLGLTNEIKIIGVDALAGEGNGLSLVSKGILDASFLYPTFGNIVMQRTNQVLHNLPYPRDTKFETSMINGVNAHIELLKIEQLKELDNRIGKLNTDLSNHERTNELQRYLIIIISIVVIVVFLVTIVIARIMVLKSRLNELLKSQNDEILQKKLSLEEQRDKLIKLSKELEDATSAKLLFYTNISHDLRTPLSLVSDPINYLLENLNVDKEKRELLLTIASRNISILLRLIDQILDFRRYENDKVELNLVNSDISKLIREWSANFNITLERSKKVINLKVEGGGNYCVMIDKERIERVYFNLLSNAIKYSVGDKPIEVCLSVIEINLLNYISIIVKNCCNGITDKNIANLFERFYQVDNSSKGSGIGLAITKVYVEQHGGNISALKENDNLLIKIILPCNINNSIIEEVVDFNENIELSFTNSENIPNSPLKDDEAKEVLLIVDDNIDIRRYLHTLLQSNYIVIEATNGAEGLQKAQEVIPDLIISDIMMDVMDGIEFCNNIKSNLLTCHVPILLLTACAADEQRINGYTCGADGYISKPFNFNVLLARIRNLIENRKIINSINKDSIESLREGITSMEKQFLERFKLCIEENISNSELCIDDIAYELGYSRSQLHRKIKALTGEAPIRIIRNTRLQKAQELLSCTAMTISEIAYDVGYSSPSYFTKSYKEYFGSLPTSK